MPEATTLLPLFRVATQVAAWGAKAADRAAILRSPVPSLSMVLAADPDTDASEQFIVTAEQCQQIEDFLADPAVVALLRMAFLRLIAPDEDAEYLGDAAGAETFDELARQWCATRDQNWQSLAPFVWARLQRDQHGLLERLQENELFGSANRDVLIERFFFRILTERTPPQYLKTIDDVARSPERQRAVRDFLQEARRVAGLADHDRFSIQGVDDHEATFSELYIDRTLTDASTGEAFSAEAKIDIWSANPRAVVIGDPGAGKTTLTSWIKWRLQRRSSDGAPVVVTLISRHALAAQGTSLLSALRRQIEADYSYIVTDETLTDLLSMGWLIPMVDGIDEILDPSHRRAIVQQINTYAERFPLSAIICTTRRTGFEVNLFRNSSFQLLSLEEYSDDQVEHYATKWFREDPDNLKAERFIGESRTLVDLRRNPLMLALLCTLYRQYDYIPQSRREVYLRCATLMFHEWDPRRGIAIPNLFKSRGDTILRDFALLLHQSGGVGTSIEEGQLISLVSNLLVDNGEERLAADAAARELLAYCSGRAWILSKVSAPRARTNQFSFTHRTFYEFFASEAIVRRTNRSNALHAAPQANSPVRLSPVASEIVQAYTADPTSVMPELLIQAADDLMGGVATPILEEIRREAVRLGRDGRQSLISLSVRLVASAGVNSIVADKVFDAMINEWRRYGLVGDIKDTSSSSIWSDIDEVMPSAGVSVIDQMRSIFDVASGHRGRLVQRFTSDVEEGLLFLVRYARIALLGETGLFSDEWRTAATTIIRTTPPAELLKDPVVAWYAASNGAISAEAAVMATSGSNLLRLSAEGRDVPGVLWMTLDQPAEDFDAKDAAWSHSLASLTASGALEVVAQSVGANALDDLHGLRQPNAFPPDLAVALGLALESSGHERLAVLLGRPAAVAFARTVLECRYQLDDLQAALQGQPSRPTKDTDDEHKRHQASIRRRLNAEYKSVRPAPCPTWVKKFVGAIDSSI